MSDDNQNASTQKHRLGDILIRRGDITKEQLEKALASQKKEGSYLGEILIRLGFVEERDIVVALVVQCNLPYIAIQNYDIDKSILKLIPAELAQKYHVIPLDRVGDILSVVMADPLNAEVKEELQTVTNCKVAPFIATKTEIEEAIDRWYGKES